MIRKLRQELARKLHRWIDVWIAPLPDFPDYRTEAEIQRDCDRAKQRILREWTAAYHGAKMPPMRELIEEVEIGYNGDRNDPSDAFVQYAEWIASGKPLTEDELNGLDITEAMEMVA